MNRFRMLFHLVAAVAHYAVPLLVLAAIIWSNISPTTWARPISTLVFVLVTMVPLRLFIEEGDAEDRIKLVVDNTR